MLDDPFVAEDRCANPITDTPSGKRAPKRVRLLLARRLVPYPPRLLADEMSFTPGSKCGAYEIVGLLGTGGMGEVYRARDSKLGRQVAIKVLRVEALANPGAVRRLQREARATTACS